MNGIVSASVRSKGYWPVQMEAVYDRVPPLGFVFVDEALNRMGVALAPTEWGKTGAWIPHPFRYDKRHDQFYRYVPRKRQSGIWTIVKSEVQSPFRKEKLAKAAALYQRLADDLSKAIQSQIVKASMLSPTSLAEIPNAAFSTQRLAIFYAGQYYRNRTAPKPVVVELLSLDRWLDQITSMPPKALPLHVRDGIVKGLLRAAEAHGIRYQNEALYDGLEHAFEAEGLARISQNEFQLRIWADPRLKGIKFGRGRSRQTDAEKMHAKLNLICGEIAKWRKALRDKYEGSSSKSPPK